MISYCNGNTVSLSSMTLEKKNHQHTLAICKQYHTIHLQMYLSLKYASKVGLKAQTFVQTAHNGYIYPASDFLTLIASGLVL